MRDTCGKGFGMSHGDMGSELHIPTRFGYIHDQEIGDQLSRSAEHSRSKQISEAASKTKSNEAIPG